MKKSPQQAAITSGDYLIVYENGNVAFNGGLSTLDAESNTINVTISNSKITANATTNAAKFTINATAGSIKSASGYYIGRTANSNGLNTSTSNALVNTLSIDSGNVLITSSGGPTLKFNNSSGQKRFRYYASGQQSIQLYKYTSSGGSAPTVSSISLDTTNVIKTFDTGDTFDYSGLVVTATYSDSTSQVINSGYTVSSPDMSTAGTKEITVSYGGKSATYNIIVNVAIPTSITATVKNGKTFFVGETITKSDITVMTDTNVDVTDSITFDNYQFTYDDAASGGTSTSKQFIVTYNGLSATLTVGVQRKARSSQLTETCSVTYTDLPTAYDTSTTERTAASGVKYIAYNLANYSSKMQFRKSGGYFQTTQEMSLMTITINNRDGSALTVYGSNTAGSFSTTITGNNDTYDLSSYKYVKIINSNDNAVYCSSIAIVVSVSETAANVANYIMYEDTNNQCTTKLNTAITYLNNLSSTELNTFKTSTDYVIATARERLEAWARNQGKTIDYSGGATHVVLKSGRFLTNSVITEDSSISLILIITSALTVSAVLGYFLLKRKKQK